MTEPRNQTNGHKAKIAAIAAVAAVFVVAGTAGYYFLAKPAPLMSFTALPGDAELDITYNGGGKTIPLALQDNGDIFADEKAVAGNYALTVNIRETESNKYRDIAVSYRADTGTAVIIANGFSGKDKVTVENQGDLFFDWAGKIELSVTAQDRPSSTCFETTAGIAFCHTLPKRTGV